MRASYAVKFLWHLRRSGTIYKIRPV
jgi:hypothetical protein